MNCAAFALISGTAVPTHTRSALRQACPVTQRRVSIRRRGRAVRNAARMQGSDTNDEGISVRLVAVPDESHMLTPGEVRQVSLDYMLFHMILQQGSTVFGLLNVDEWNGENEVKARGVLLSILSVKNVTQAGKGEELKSVPRIMVECRCSGRFDVMEVAEGAVDKVPTLWSLLEARCVLVKDWMCYEHRDRLEIAQLEEKVWRLCLEVAALMRKLGVRTKNGVLVEQELAVWAPKDYDTEISEEEWKRTPTVTRAVYCERAESFSFGVLRCMKSDDSALMRARAITNTALRLELAVESIEKRRARTTAELSLKNALN